jgi:hypothetical protein
MKKKNPLSKFTWAVFGLALAFTACPDLTVDNKGPPELTGTVTISGEARVGQTLAVVTTALEGSGEISCQWFRNDEAIPDATGPSYVLVDADVGKTIKVEVTRADNKGKVTSAATAVVTADDRPALTGTVSISGEARVGQTLTADITNLGGTGTISYRWFRGDTFIDGATGQTYTLGAADAGSAIKVEVTRAGNSRSVTSEATGNTENNTVPTTLRYATVPYSGLDKLVYSAYDDEKYYYVFLLGHIDYVPLSFRPAVEYNGTTPITIGYEMSDITETATSRSLTEATENSVTTSESSHQSSTWNIEVSAGIEIGFFSAGGSGSKGGESGHESGRENMSGRSRENTYETVRTIASENRDSIEVTVGEHDEPRGLYRYSLFTTTDVYAVVVTDHDKTTTKNYLNLCARPNTYWGLDYEPEPGGDFGKTAPGDLLTIPEFAPSDLPTPESNDLTPVPPDKTAPLTASHNTGSYEAEAKVTLACETEGAAIYYTLDGTIPTKASTIYTGAISITTDTTLRAIAVSDDREDSEVLIRQYTITDQALQTVWSFALTDIKPVLPSDDTFDYFTMANAETYKNFDITRLKAAGYTSIDINCNAWAFGASATIGRIEGWVRAGHGGAGQQWAYGIAYSSPLGEWKPIGFTKSISINDFTEDFTLQWGAYDYFTAWYVGARTVTFTAKKPGQQ